MVRSRTVTSWNYGSDTLSKAFAVVNSLYVARSCLNAEVVHDLGFLAKKLEAITEGHVDEEGDD